MGLLGGASALALLGGQASAAAPVDETPGLAPPARLPNCWTRFRTRRAFYKPRMSGRSPMLPVTKARWLPLNFNTITITTITTTTIITGESSPPLVESSSSLALASSSSLATPSTPRLLRFAKPRAVGRNRSPPRVASHSELHSNGIVIARSDRGSERTPFYRRAIACWRSRAAEHSAFSGLLPPGIYPGVAMTRWFNPNAIRPCARG